VSIEQNSVMLYSIDVYNPNCAEQYSTVQCSVVQYSTEHCTTVKYSIVKCCAVQTSTVK
jgi:hypothetical protein